MKKIIFSMSFILLMISRPVFATTLSDLSASMMPGTWAQLTTLVNEGGKTYTQFWHGPSGGPNNGYANKGGWDPIHKVLNFHGHPHLSSDPDVFFKYTDSNNTWTSLTPAIPSGQGLNYANHAYEHNTTDPTTGDHYYKPFGDPTIYKYTYATNAWSVATSFNIAVNRSTGVLTWFPDMNALIWIQGEGPPTGGVYKWTPSTNTWSRLGDVQIGYIHAIGDYDPVGHQIIFGGGNPDIYDYSKYWWKLSSSGVITRLADSPIAAGINKTNFAVDPVSGRGILTNTTKEMYELNTVSNTWTKLSITTPIVMLMNDDWTYNSVVTPISTYGVIMYATSNNQVYLYKHALPSVCASGCTYNTLQGAVDAASAGATITVSPETFTGAAGRFKISAKNNLTIRVSTPGSYFTIDCQNSVVDGKGCIYLTGSGGTVIDGAKVINSGDSAGSGAIRTDSATGDLTIKNSWLKDGHNHGVLAGAPNPKGSYNITIQNTIIDGFGSSGGGQEHGIYIGAYNNLYVRYNLFQNIWSGHNIKTRAKNNYIEYNKVLGGATATNTNSVDISCGGVVYAIGNIFEKGTAFLDGITSADMFRIGKDTGPSCPVDNSWNIPTQVYVVNNTFLHDLPPNGTLSWGYIYRSPALISWPNNSVFQSKNNIYYFKGNTGSYLVSDPASRAPDETTNLLVKDADPGWVNMAAYNYGLLGSASMIINGGTDPGFSLGGYSLTPTKEYAGTASYAMRLSVGALDIGAYEYASGADTTPPAAPTGLLVN